MDTAYLHSILVSQINQNAVLKGETQCSMLGCLMVSYKGVQFTSSWVCRESYLLE